MKTKLIILLCALTGVLNTYATIKEINDSTIKFTTNLGGIGRYADSTKYNTYIMDGSFLATDIIKVKDYYDSLIVNFDLSKVKLLRLSGYTAVETHTFQNGILQLCPNLRVIKFPVNCDTINADVFGSGNTQLKKLDSIYISNETKVLTVTNDGVNKLWRILDDGGYYYSNRIISGDTIVVMVPRALYSAYKAKTNYDNDWFRFKIVAYDVPIASGINTPNKTSNVSIYPTITKDVININGVESGQSSQTSQISIIDIGGNTMIRDEIKSQINVSALAKGLYLVNINNQCVGKFIKQ
jgi:hypothetical protein